MRSSIPFRSLVSIIMVNEFAENYIKKTIESVRQQTYENWELIIVENLSKDDSSSEIKEIMMEDSRIKLVTLQEPISHAEACNFGITMARGRYLAFINNDDIWPHHKLEKQLEFMEAHNIGFSCTDYQIIDESNKAYEPIIVMPEQTTYSSFLHNVNLIAGSTVMIDRYIIGKIQLTSNENIPEESALWLSIFKRGFKAYAIKEVLLFKRRHNHSLDEDEYKKASKVWSLYRHVEKLNIFESAYCFMNNAKSEAKYRNLKN
ncbi:MULTISPECIES: glycosyltransferase family 2 protein [Bacillaceae]|uniref:glycosyltransferase family 2 protein n=1 Tax=Bacillaceae TaxID=186817 RepID=UPI0006707C60|nr:glycosyltransferase family 2 protein [Bacillus sp. FJAT-27916]